MPMIFIIMNIVYAATAYPIGVLSDRIGRNGLLAMGILLLIVADIMLAFGGNLIWIFAGVVLWGLHLGMTEGLLSALIAGAAPADVRGTAFGIYNLLTGMVALVASGLAGLLWTAYGPAETFTAGAIFAAISLVGMWRVGSKYLK
jgi:MFS family permease